MEGVTAKKSLSKQVREKAKQRKCLICGKDATGNRGLCVAHYLQFYRAMNSLPKRQRRVFEEEQIREGRILAAGQVREIKNPNPFVSEAG